SCRAGSQYGGWAAFKWMQLRMLSQAGRHVAARHDKRGRAIPTYLYLSRRTRAASSRPQFFVSLKKWIGARNPVKTGSSCAAVTGYDFPRPIVRHLPDGEGGKKGKDC